jgi:DNA-binding transcriptional regulator YiaG
MTPDAVRQLRHQTGLSLRQLARALAVHHVTIWRWEHGKVVTSPRNRLRLLTVVMHTVRRTVDRGGQNG